MIEYTNSVCNTTDKYICNSRPRRFGKSYTADMLTAYYSRGCQSEELFHNYQISHVDSFHTYLNQCEVLHLDIQWCMLAAGSADRTIAYINQQVLDEMRQAYPSVDLSDKKTVYDAMSAVNTALGIRFVVILDEWVILIRDESGDHTIQNIYQFSERNV